MIAKTISSIIVIFSNIYLLRIDTSERANRTFNRTAPWLHQCHGDTQIDDRAKAHDHDDHYH